MSPRKAPLAVPAKPVVEVVDPRWLLKAAAIALAAALICGYAALCFLFWQGSWQLVLHPKRAIHSTPASIRLAYENVAFAPDAAGAPQLAGWWIPSDTDATVARTALVLHGADGSMEDSLPQASILHDAHLNVILFDYHGFGASKGKHPLQKQMDADTRSAFDYLVRLRHIPASQTVLFGEGVGASLAVRACNAKPFACSALILDAPDGDLADRVRADPRTRLLPVRLLFHDPFPLAQPLASSPVPKLLVTYGSAHLPAAVRDAATPKTTVELPTRDAVALDRSIKRFLDDYPPAHDRKPATN